MLQVHWGCSVSSFSSTSMGQIKEKDGSTALKVQVCKLTTGDLILIIIDDLFYDSASISVWGFKKAMHTINSKSSTKFMTFL